MFVFLTRIQSNLIKTYHFLDAKLSTERRAVVVLGTTFAQQVETIMKDHACAEKEAIESLLALSGGEESGTTVDHHNNENENNNNNNVEAGVAIDTERNCFTGCGT
ncbi:hypothetical protein ADEAN_000506900 [Angomonas deanei]|uniref:Uncharacterized protein n=1 Tax=Angomonas deanei TaxID=59799 RepID=A0A7G2CF34_9TRYP|nr:hypothetical protein ADEAN_000506900 [Angomonas deanei]